MGYVLPRLTALLFHNSIRSCARKKTGYADPPQRAARTYQFALESPYCFAAYYSAVGAEERSPARSPDPALREKGEAVGNNAKK
jgi:hypothetical protein